MENNTPKKKQFPAYLTLCIIALIAAVVLAATNMLTRGPIKEHEMAALKEAFGTVMPADSYEQISLDESYTKAGVDNLYKALDADGNLVGYCVKAAQTGYANSVAVTLGVDTNGVVNACVVGDTNFQETETLGGRARKPEFQDQFKGLDAVNGGSFDALSGATVTSKAVLGATNAALKCVAEVALNKAQETAVAFGEGKKQNASASQPALTGEVHTGSAKGFGGDVTVNATLDDAGVVTAIQIDANCETPGFGQRVMEEEDFQKQFVGKSGPFVLGENVDALSGATITSTAVVEALNQALTAPASAREALIGTAKGFGGDVVVTLTMDGDKIASITIDASSETPGFGQRVMEEADYQAQFIGKTLPVEGVDALSGATITSTAVLEAVNSAAAPAATEEPAATEAPVAEGTPISGAAQGFQSEVTVTATIDDDKAITSIKINADGETPGFGQRTMEDEDFLKQFIGKKLPLELSKDVDALSGATITSTAIVTALNSTVPAEETATEAPTDAPTEAPAVSLEDINDNQDSVGEAQGFASIVTVYASYDADGAIASIKINADGETPGFGQRTMEDEDFLKQFIGKKLPLELSKDVDALSGATITSTAIVTALNSTVPAEETATEAPTDAPTEAPAVSLEDINDNQDSVGEAQGFASIVTVYASYDADGAIASIKINADGETPGFGQRTMEDEDFLKQFIGKKLPLELGKDVDALSGATITSTAVVEALNNSAVPLTADAAVAAEAATATELTVEAPAATSVPVVEEATATDAATDTDLATDTDAATGTDVASTTDLGTATDLATATDLSTATDLELTVEGQGFQSTVTVTVTLDAEGVITAIKVNADGETPGFGQRTMEDEDFLKQFIGKKLPLELGKNKDVDVLSGATITSTAIVDALNTLAK